MSKVITVFGATGNQGGSVIKAILEDPGLSKVYKIRAVTRDTSKPAAQKLAQQGCELVTANIDDKNSVAKILKGSDTVFLVTNYWESNSAKIEIQQGKNVADAAKEAGVKYIIFSSLINANKASNGKFQHVAHWDSKAEVEQYIRVTGINCAFVMPGYFMSNFTKMMRKGDDAVYSLAFPISGSSGFPLIDISADYGKFVVPALKHPEEWNGKNIHAAAANYPLDQVISDFEEVTGSKVNFIQVSNEQYKSSLPEFMAQEMLENHLTMEDPGYFGGADLEPSLAALESKPTTWKEFVAKNW